MSNDTFEDTHDAGMWVSRSAVHPVQMETLGSLDQRLAVEGIELLVLDQLTALKSVWSSTLDASGIRLRNTVNWR